MCVRLLWNNVRLPSEDGLTKWLVNKYQVMNCIVHSIKNVSETCICLHSDVLVDDPLIHLASTGKGPNGQV